MKNFMYLFRGGDSSSLQESPEAWQTHMQKWMTWMEQLKDQGTLKDGLPLSPAGRVVENAGEVVTDGPFAEGKEVVGGYLIVNAKDIDHAVEISKGCPIYETGGNTEVREIIDM